MSQGRIFWFKVAVILMVLALIIPILVACGSSNGKTTTPVATTPVATTPAVTTPPASTPAVSKDPVKIGFMTSYTGSFAAVAADMSKTIDLVTQLVNGTGGVLGGRPIQIVTYDCASEPSTAVAGLIKLTTSDNVAVMASGGTITAQVAAVLDEAKRTNWPGAIFNWSTTLPNMGQNWPNGVRVITSQDGFWKTATRTVTALRPKTVGVLITQEFRAAFNQSMLPQLSASGIKVVYTGDVPAGTVDMTPFVTAIKFANPDLLMLDISSPAQNTTFFTNIPQVGGLGNMVIFNSAPGSASTIWALPAVQGTYQTNYWMPGLNYPGAQKFEQDWKAKYGNTPPTAASYYSYMGLMTAINAIQLAGTADPAAILKAAKSGNLKWDTPSGPVTWGTDGENTNEMTVVKIQGGQPVQVTLSQP